MERVRFLLLPPDELSDLEAVAGTILRMEADSDSLDDFIDTVTFFSDDATTYREYYLGNAHLKVRTR